MLFYGCVWSSPHDSIAPWCYTETFHLHGYTHIAGEDKWGICSNDCPVEDCPQCEPNFSYKGDNFTDCTLKGWTADTIHEFGSSKWCYTDNSRKIWKLCSDKCQPKNMRINSSCRDSNHDIYHEDNVKEHHTLYRNYENQLSNCSSETGFGGNKWCPIQLDPGEKAFCLEMCEI